MKLISVREYVNFRCTGEKCPICCCGGKWKILIDKETAEYYESVEGEFGERLRDGIQQYKGESYFYLKKNGDCLFLDDQKLCTIQKKLGEKNLCTTCRNYPRIFYNVGDILFCYLTNSCPEVNRILLDSESPLEIIFDDSEENPIIDKKTREKMDYALSAYSIGIKILQNRDYSISERMSLLLFFIKRFQEIIEQGGNPTDIITAFSVQEIYSKLLENMDKPKIDYFFKISVFCKVVMGMSKYYFANPAWEKCMKLISAVSEGKILYDINKIENAFARIEDRYLQIEAEKLLSYRFFAMFMRGFDKNDYFDKVVYECIVYTTLQTYIALSEIVFGEECSKTDRIQFYSICYRTDHTESKEQLETLLKNEGFYELEKLIRYIS